MPRRVRRDYNNRKLRNPYREPQNSIRPGRLRPILFFLILVGFLGVLVGLNRSEYFRIKNISIQNSGSVNTQVAQDIVRGQLDSRRWLMLNQRNIFFFSKSQARKNLLERFSLERVGINKNLPDELIIELIEKKSSLIWVTGDKRYSINMAGEVVEEVSARNVALEPTASGTQLVRIAPAAQNVPVVYDDEDRELVVGQPFISPSLVSFILDLHELTPARADFDILRYSVDRLNSDQLTLLTSEGWRVVLNTNDDVASQLSRLFLLLQQKVPNRSSLEYIDLRFEERIFFK